MSKNKPTWAVFAPGLPPGVLEEQARIFEQAGLEGVFAPQVYGPPFVPLAAAAAVTDRVRLASGIAMAFTRSPFETAMAAIDLDRISDGRFTLGMGTGIQAWNEGIFGVPYGKPLEHLRETVELVRLIIAKAHTGELKSYEGKYHRHDFSELQPTSPPLRTDIPIWFGALRGALISMTAEIADGLIGHPLWSMEWMTKKVPEALKVGLDRAGKQREAIEVNYWPLVMINNDRAEAINDARPTIAFYAGMAQYDEYFAGHGFPEEARRLQEGVKRGDYLGVAHLVPDEMVETFVACGSPDDVRRKVAPLWEIADSMCPVPAQYGLPDEKVLAYTHAIASTFYGGG